MKHKSNLPESSIFNDPTLGTNANNKSKTRDKNKANTNFGSSDSSHAFGSSNPNINPFVSGGGFSLTGNPSNSFGSGNYSMTNNQKPTAHLFAPADPSKTNNSLFSTSLFGTKENDSNPFKANMLNSLFFKQQEPKEKQTENKNSPAESNSMAQGQTKTAPKNSESFFNLFSPSSNSNLFSQKTEKASEPLKSTTKTQVKQEKQKQKQTLKRQPLILSQTSGGLFDSAPSSSPPFNNKPALFSTAATKQEQKPKPQQQEKLPVQQTFSSSSTVEKKEPKSQKPSLFQQGNTSPYKSFNFQTKQTKQKTKQSKQNPSLLEQVEEDIENGRKITSREKVEAALERQKKQIRNQLIKTLKAGKKNVVLKNRNETANKLAEQRIKSLKSKNDALEAEKMNLLSEIQAYGLEIEGLSKVKRDGTIKKPDFKQREIKASLAPKQYVDKFYGYLPSNQVKKLHEEIERRERQCTSIQNNLRDIQECCKELERIVQEKNKELKEVDRQLISIFDEEEQFKAYFEEKFSKKRQQLELKYQYLKKEVKERRTKPKSNLSYRMSLIL